MKRKMSMAFLLLAVTALFSITGLFNSLRMIFTASGIANAISSFLSALLPIALVILLYLNANGKDVKKPASTVLTIVGILSIFSAVLQLLYSLTYYFVLSNLVSMTFSILMAILYFTASGCIKNRKKSNTIVNLTIACFIFSLMINGQMVGWIRNFNFNILTHLLKNVFLPLLLPAAICLLPETLYHYDKCVFVDRKSLKGLGIIAAMVAGILLITGVAVALSR